MFDFPLLKGKIPSLPHVVIERTLKHDIDDLVAALLPPMKLAVVDDGNTRAAYGETVFRALKGRYPAVHVTLDSPLPDKETAEYLRKQTLSCDALIAVGSGTLNDLCKYVSHKDGKPYLVFPTAASMNGYLSANASISEGGFKKTLPAHMPKAVFCDLAILCAAPPRLSQSGLGDCLARPTAQADWLLSHLLLGTPYDETPFTLLAPLEPELFEQAKGIAGADPRSIELLMKTLLLSGLGMTVAGGSYPASQGEHMIAHAMEMMKKSDGALHGEQIGVTTLTMARLQEKCLRGKPAFRPDDFDAERLRPLFGEKITQEAKKAFAAKQALLCHPERSEGSPRDSSASPQNDRMADWESIAEKIERVMIPSEKLQAILEAADASVMPEDLNWNPKDYDIAQQAARYTRERFTFLDLK